MNKQELINKKLKEMEELINRLREVEEDLEKYRSDTNESKRKNSEIF